MKLSVQLKGSSIKASEIAVHPHPGKGHYQVSNLKPINNLMYNFIYFDLAHKGNLLNGVGLR